MTWDATAKYDFLIDSKNLVVRLATAVTRRLDLGQPVDGYLDMLYLGCNIVFALEDTASDYTDAEFDLLYGLYTKLLVKHNTYLKGFITGL